MGSKTETDIRTAMMTEGARPFNPHPANGVKTAPPTTESSRPGAKPAAAA